MSNETVQDQVRGDTVKRARKSFILVLIVSIVLIIGGIAAGIWVQHSRNNSKSQKQFDAALQRSNAAFTKGEYDTAVTILKGVVGDAKTAKDKVKVYSQLAAITSSAGKIGEALQYYKLKHNLDPSTTPPDAYLVGSLYERSSDNKNAVAQYKIALAYQKTLPQTLDTKQTTAAIQQRIKDIGGQ